jgi:ankyrin repeat protein
MIDPAHQPYRAARREQEPAPDSALLQFAAKVFNLARQGDTDTLAAYVDAGVPANLCNDKGDTLVMLAAYHGHPQTVSVLLERGADPNRPNDRGQTPLAGAVFKGERAVIEALIDGGADPPPRAARRLSRPPGCSAWTTWSRSSRAADADDR